MAQISFSEFSLSVSPNYYSTSFVNENSILGGGINHNLTSSIGVNTTALFRVFQKNKIGVETGCFISKNKIKNLISNIRLNPLEPVINVSYSINKLNVGIPIFISYQLNSGLGRVKILGKSGVILAKVYSFSENIKFSSVPSDPFFFNRKSNIKKINSILYFELQSQFKISRKIGFYISPYYSINLLKDTLYLSVRKSYNQSLGLAFGCSIDLK